MGGFSLHPLENETLLAERRADPSVRELPPTPGFFQGALGATGSGLVSALASTKMAFDAAGEYLPDAFFEDDDKPFRPLTDRERQFGTIQASSRPNNAAMANLLTDLRPDPQTTGTLGQVTYGLTSMLPQAVGGALVGGPVGAAVAVGGSTGVADYQMGLAEGLDPNTAISRGLLTGSTNAVGALLPASLGSTILRRIGSGVALNVPLGMAQRGATGELLRANGYEEMADQYRAFSGTEILIDAVVGGAFGVLPNGEVGPVREQKEAPPPPADTPMAATPPSMPPAGDMPVAAAEAPAPTSVATATTDAMPVLTKVLPSDIDLALAANAMNQFELDAAPGIPATPAARNGHVKAMDTAYQQLMNNESVNVEGLLDNAEMLPKPAQPDVGQAVQSALEEGGYADLIREAQGLRDEASRRGIPLGDDLAQLPDVATGNVARDVATAQVTPDARPFVAQAEKIRQLLDASKLATKAAKNVNRRSSRAVQKAINWPVRPVTLLEYVQNLGGISNGLTAKEIGNIKASGKRVTDFYPGELTDLFDGKRGMMNRYVRSNGLSFEDELPNAAAQAGYLGEALQADTYRMENPDQARERFYEALKKSINGTPVYDYEVTNALEQADADLAERTGMGDVEAADAWLADLSNYGLESTDPTVTDLAEALAKQDAAIKEEFPGDQKVSPFQQRVLEQYDDIPFMRGSEVQTPAFKRWFGNSKIVDAAGNPLVVYHGTNATFDAFDANAPRANDMGFFGKGFYFATSAGEANYYGSKVGAYYLKIERPLDLSNETGDLTFPGHFRAWYPKLKKLGLTTPEVDALYKADAELMDFARKNAVVMPYEPGGFTAKVEHPVLGTVWASSNYLGKGAETTAKAIEQVHYDMVRETRWHREQFPDMTYYTSLSDYVRTELPGGAEALSKAAKAMGHDGILYGDELVAFEPTQIKSVENIGTFDANDARVRFMRPAVQRTDTPEFKAWFSSSKVTDENGKPQVVYHGAQRSDRVAAAGKFDRAKATSGPMGYFTDSPEIASNYATGKKDTSLEIDSLADFFTINGVRGDFDKAWASLSATDRVRIRKEAWKVGSDEDTGAIGFTESGLSGERHFTNVLNDRRGGNGNPLRALYMNWVESGQLYNEEARFTDVLKTLGIKAEYDDPYAVRSGVFPVYLSIKNPLDTQNVPQNVLAALEAASVNAPKAETAGVDQWDKRAQDPQEWVATLKEDAAKGNNSFVWTSIPDWVTATLQSMGYDGIKDTGGKMASGVDHNVWIPFEEPQVKSVFNRGTFDANDPRISFMRPADAEDVNPLGFYSQLARVAGMKLPGKGTGDDFTKAFDAYAKQGDFKPEELEYSGVKEWLSTQERVSKADVLDFLRNGGVKLEEVVLADSNPMPARMTPDEAIDYVARQQDMTRDEVINEWGYENPNDYVTLAEGMQEDDLTIVMGGSPSDGKPKFGKYTLPGGTSYREVLLTLPPAPLDERAFAKWMSNTGRNIADYPENEISILRAQAAQENARDSRTQFRSSHWDQPNVLAHFRLADHTDAEGKRVLLIEEIQSDWHQEGRKKGYDMGANQEKIAQKNELLLENERLNQREEEITLDRLLDKGDDEALAQESQVIFQRRSAIAREIRILDRDMRDERLGKVPDAPFKKTWAELSFKRILRMASERGYERVAWTTGQIQAERYDLSKQISKVEWLPKAVGMNATKAGVVRAWDLNGRNVLDRNAAPDELPDIIGKEVAEKLVNSEPSYTTGLGYAVHKVEGLDLKVGGEGMKGFYDDILPKLAGKVIGKLDKQAKVGEVRLPEPRKHSSSEIDAMSDAELVQNLTAPVGKGGVALHGFDLTPELRERVMLGLPQFYRASGGTLPDGIEPLAPGLARMEAQGVSADDLLVAQEVNAVVGRMLPGAEVRMSGRLFSTGEAGAPGEVFGAFRRPLNVRESRGVIDWSLEAPDAVGVARHEVVHGLKEAGLFSREEWDALTSAALAEDWAGRAKISNAYKPGERLEEAIAERFRTWRREAPDVQARGVTAPIYQAFSRLAALLHHVGAVARRWMGLKPTAADVFGRIESGEIGRRQPETMRQERAAVSQVDQVLADKPGLQVVDDTGRVVDGKLAMMDADADAIRAEQFGPLHEVAINCYLRG